MAGKARSRAEDTGKARGGKLTALDRATIAGMLGRGDRIQDVAYWYGVSPSTVHAIKVAWPTHGTLEYALELPPPGPYQLVRKVEYVQLVDIAAMHKTIVAELELLAEKYRPNAQSRV